MLIFHEGLPGSGKSFASIKDHIVPALQKGRKVFAYIEGLNHEKVAQVAEITIDDCQKLLFQITKEQVPTIYSHVENDSLVVVDELQDFWPASRQKLGPEITEFVTQHRHRGLDLLLMGQVLGDCHSIWKNRVDQLVHFYKRDAIGKDDEYKWSVQKRGSGGKFAEVTSGVCKYEAKYFGTYASHTGGTENTENYKDERANVWNSKVMRVGLPLYGLIAAVALGVVIWAFNGGLVQDDKKPEPKKEQKAEQPLPQASPVPTKQVAASVPKLEESAKAEYMPLPAPDIIDNFTSKYRARLAGFIEFKGKRQGFIEWRDPANAVKEVLSLNAVQGLGWLVMVSPDGQIATLQKVNQKYYVTAWPIEEVTGKFSQQQQENLRKGTIPVNGGVAQGEIVSPVKVASNDLPSVHILPETAPISLSAPPAKTASIQ